MNRLFLIPLLAGALLLTACGAAGGKNAAGNSPDGTWYEQSPDGRALKISGGRIQYLYYDGTWSDPEKCSFVPDGGRLLIQTEDFWAYEDMSYDPSKDIIEAYTLSHTDGDGGHNYREFRRTEYVPPPAPVYPDPVDNSDPDAPREFEDLAIRHMKVSFYDEGEPYDPDSSMAMELPYPDEYEYDLTVLDDGTGRVSSSFCREIALSSEQVESLIRMAEDAQLGSINGIDIHTEGLPYDSPWYEAEIELKSGEVIRSSANGDSVPEAWKSFQHPMHRLLFFAFIDAGYEYGSGEFHSTAPMKRVQGSAHVFRENTGIAKDTKRITPDWKKSWDYSLDTQYFVFSDPSNRYPALMKTLGELSEKYKKIAETELEKDYAMMEAVPAGVWKKADRRYCYSLYAVDNWEINGRIFSFTVSEGHANSLGVGENGYGKYRYIRYHVDMKTGRILTLADLFRDPEEAAEFLTESMQARFGTYNDYGKRVHADDFGQAVREAFSKPEPYGIGFNIEYKRLTLWMPLSMFPNSDSQLMETLYYDECQEILGETFTEVW